MGSAARRDLSGIGWDSISGGIHKRTPYLSLYALVSCERVIGSIDHSGTHGPHPHSIKVCILKTDNNDDIYEALSAIVGVKPPLQTNRFYAKPVAKMIVDAMLNEGEHPGVQRIGDLMVIMPRRIPELVSPYEVTTAGRSKSLRMIIARMMLDKKSFVKTKYRNGLAYRRRPLPGN